MDSTIKGRRVLVTGASKGIGKAIAIALGQQGYDIAVNYLSDQAGAENTLDLITELGGSGHLLPFDISNRAQCRHTLEQDIAQFGAFYGVVSNAGITADTAFPAMEEAQWDRVIHTNLDSFYNVIQPCVMPMIRARKGGRILSIASVSGMIGNRGQTNYSAAKAGIIGASKALALELASRKITVNCIAPGLIDTGMIDESVKERALPQIPMNKMGKPEDIAQAAAFLMSDGANYITRQVLAINGGLN
ncbi:3-ketoacyl-ACP reductase FabG2 [Thaumasiovibrio subtropicus]|uniref:3-ketoacyl-ACP reductase FabG2 n=1 Tax=Thaumasiovibrio subtropicus TaxID=1891207 RepID=UPI000B35791A|nr:3-ketoacyl-ACP reductase FabG2 [Thaumasiovibrio subtropicus]